MSTAVSMHDVKENHKKKIEKKILHKKQPATETNVSAILCHTWTHSTLKITSGKTKLDEELSHELPNYLPSVIDLHEMAQQV